VWISDQEGRLVGKNAQADRIWAGDAPLMQTIDEYPQYQSWNARTVRHYSLMNTPRSSPCAQVNPLRL